MTDEKAVNINQPGFEIKETVVTTGYVDKEGKFHETGAPEAYVQITEDTE